MAVGELPTYTHGLSIRRVKFASFIAERGMPPTKGVFAESPENPSSRPRRHKIQTGDFFRFSTHTLSPLLPSIFLFSPNPAKLRTSRNYEKLSDFPPVRYSHFFFPFFRLPAEFRQRKHVAKLPETSLDSIFRQKWRNSRFPPRFYTHFLPFFRKPSKRSTSRNQGRTSLDLFCC